MMKRTVPGITTLFVLSLIAAAAFAFTAEQASRGEKLYATHCAACHGADARGGTVPEGFGTPPAGMKAPALAGQGALKEMDNAAEVYEYASTRMPADKPGSLESEQYLDIVSFALQANGLKPDNQPLTPESAEDIKLSGAKR